jgi:hypothetical protein
MEQLRNLSRGHALSQGRNYITMEDIPIAIKTVLSTASMERVNIFDLLLGHNGTLTTPQIELSLTLHRHVAHRTMAELKAVGLVDLNEGAYDNSLKTITLKPEFNWFLEPDFVKLREEFVPADYSEYLKKEKKDKPVGTISTPYYPDSDTGKGLGGKNSADNLSDKKSYDYDDYKREYAL